MCWRGMDTHPTMWGFKNWMNFNSMFHVPSEQSKQEFRQVEINGNLMRFCHWVLRDRYKVRGRWICLTKTGNNFFFGQPVFQKYTLNGPVWLFLIILHSGNYMSFNLYADLHTGQNINPIPLPSEGCKRLLIENMKNISTWLPNNKRKRERLMVRVYCLITNETSSKRKNEEIYASNCIHACLFCFNHLC